MSEPVSNPWPRRLGLTALAVIGLMMLAIMIVWLWIRSDAGRNFVEATVEEMEFAGQSVELDGLNGSLLDSFSIDELQVMGRDGAWLIVRDVTISWSPRALLSKTLHIEDVRVGEMEVLQRPVLIPSGSGEDPSVTTFDIRNIDLPDIRVAEPVIGRSIDLSASGQLRHSPDGGTALMTARSDQGDRIDANLAWSPLLVLSGTADIDGPPGGLIAGLLQLADGQGVTADVSTQGSETTLVARTDGGDLADLQITRSQSQVGISGTIDPSRLPLMEQAVPFLGGRTTVDAIWPLDESAQAVVALQAPKLTLDATGQQDGGTIRLDMLSLDATDPLQGFDLDGIAIASLTASGQAVLGEAYTFDGRVDARALRYQHYRVDRLTGPVSLRLEASQLRFDADLTGQASDSPAQRADGARVTVSGEYDLEARRVALSRANVDLPGLAFAGRGQIGLNDPMQSMLDGRYTIDTSILREGPAAQLSGNATLRRTPGGPVIDLSGQARQIVGLADAVAPLVTEPVDYRARLRFTDGQVGVPQFTLGNSLFTASGTGNWRDGEVSVNADYRADRYMFAALSAETISGKATVSGPAERLNFDTQLSVQTLITGTLRMSDAVIDATGTYSDGVIEASGTVDAQSEQGPVSVQGSVVQDSGNWTVTELEGSLGNLRTRGTLSGSGGDIAALRADLTLSGSSPLIPAESIEGQILFGDARVDVDVVLTGIEAGRLQDGQARIIAQGPREAVAFEIDATALTIFNDLERPLTLQTTGLADLTVDTTRAESQFTLGVGSQTLTGDASVQQRDGGWALAANADGLGGQLVMTVDTGANGGISLDVEDLTVASLARLVARPATEGTVSGKARFLFVDNVLEGQAALRLNNLRSPISQSEPISLLARIELSDQRLLATMEATEGGLSGQARLAGPVQTFVRAPFLQWPPEAPLQGEANFRGEVGPLVEIFLPPRTDVAGQVDTELRFTVPMSRSDLTGRIALTKGLFEQGALGLRLENIAITAELSGETISVPTLSAEGVDGGRLSGSGRMGVGEGTGTVDIQATRLRVIDRGEVEAEVSGELNLSRTAELLRLAGELRVTDATLNIARLPKPGLPTLEVDFGGEEQEESTQSFASATTELDIKVLSSNGIKVRGRGLNASMGLDASVRGSFDNPVVTGDMMIERGRFDFLGKRFELRDSSVLLRDDILQSVLALEAIRRTSDLTAVVQVTGTVERPEIELTAEPMLPEDEVLSRVLFGRSPTQLSAIETARLAAALTQLSGGSGFDLFGTLEDAVGLDTLEIGQNEGGQTQLTTGKYLSDDVYLEVRTAAEGTPGIAVEWQVRENISLEAETQPNERQRLSVQWKKDFD